MLKSLNYSLPTLDDRLELPYVDALVKEVFRWQPVTPLGTLDCSPDILA
jgi:hypothetical protein